MTWSVNTEKILRIYVKYRQARNRSPRAVDFFITDLENKLDFPGN